MPNTEPHTDCAFGSDFFVKKKFLEDIGLFYEATDTSVFDFWWRLPWILKPGWISSLVCYLTCMQQNPQIHLWCDTWWPLGGKQQLAAAGSSLIM